MPTPDESDNTAPASAQPGRPRRRKLPIVLGTVAAILAGGMWLVLHDDAPPDDADLAIELPPPFDGESMLDRLLVIEAELPGHKVWELELEGWSGEDAWESAPLDPFWRAPETLSAMEEHYRPIGSVIDRIEPALDGEATGWTMPSSWDAEYIGLSEARKLHEYLQGRALWRRARGQTAAASQDVRTVFRLGDQHGSGSSSSLLHVLITIAFLQSGWRSTLSLLHDGELDREVERWLIERPPLRDRDPGIPRRALRGDYHVLCTVIDESREEMESRLARWMFKPERTKRLLAERTRLWIAEIERPPSERMSPDELLGTPGDAMRRAVWTMNSGEIVVPMLFSPTTIERMDKWVLTERAGRTIVALRAFEREHGALPPDLAALVAAFPVLGAPPIDPWSGGPLRYDPTRRILWSVGADGVDGGGDGLETLREDPSENRYDLPDWIWTIPPRPE